MEEGTVQNVIESPRLRPVGDHLRDAFLLIYRHWAPLAVAQMLMYLLIVGFIVAGVVIVLIPVFWGGAKGLQGEELARFIFTSPFMFGAFLIFIPVFLISSWGYSAMISALGCKEAGMAPIGGSLKRGFGLMLPVAGLMVIYSLVSFGSMLLLFFPAMILAVGLSMAWYIRVLEDVSIFQAIGTSWQITKGCRWSIFGRFALVFAIMFAINMGITVASAIPVFGILTNLAGFAVSFAVTPYMCAYLYLIYEDLRSVRKNIYPMNGGILIFMIVCLIVTAAFFAGGAALAVHLLRSAA